MNNIAQQLDELEVLNSIFGNNWKNCKDIDNTYSIKLAKDVEMWITMNEFYPSDKPPTYELWAPNLTRCQKDIIHKEFTAIYKTEKGFPIIFQWIEKVKEVMEGKYIPYSGAEENPLKENTFAKDNRNNTTYEKAREKAEFSKETALAKLPELNIIHGDPITDRRSTFQGHVCEVTDSAQVKKLLENLLENKKIRDAKHNVMAYRIVTDRNTIQKDCDDDGEAHAGGRLLHLLDILDVRNVAVVVSRWYGGIHLGSDRFKHYNNAGRQALTHAGLHK